MSKTLTDKQRKMVAAAESIAKDSSRMEEIIRQKKLEQQRRKDVFHAIEKLINPVDNEELRTQLPLIDSNSWLEVVEERYISKLCGFPTCSGSVDKNAKTQMYRIDRKSKKVYVACTDRQKYCSEICFERSIGIRAQLADQPFWLTGSRHEKQYDLSLQKKEKPVLVVEDIFVDETPLITKFGELTVAESAETDEEDEDAENSQTDDTDGLAKSLSTFLSMKPSSSVTSAPLATAGSSQESSLKPVKQSIAIRSVRKWMRSLLKSIAIRSVRKWMRWIQKVLELWSCGDVYQRPASAFAFYFLCFIRVVYIDSSRMLDLTSFDRPLGYCILATCGVCVPYLLIWLLAIPFIDDESSLRLLFPAQKYALLIPLISFLVMVTVVALFGIAVFIKERIQNLRPAKKRA
ncbi:hypothetical protein QR680_017765 [Steinernema hermaphroditum]|uniref:RNA polymerase II subunit B1 CTD phosphatase RPAP2 homolog n=1 Tax=Steinernema hermaphroditum TaxID=289476 RepID=A0AA39HHX5_9BILA|nr:hypothetical protein QR680_017765 [Steinernema hermaphroditum]